MILEVFYMRFTSTVNGTMILRFSRSISCFVFNFFFIHWPKQKNKQTVKALGQFVWYFCEFVARKASSKLQKTSKAKPRTSKRGRGDGEGCAEGGGRFFKYQVFKAGVVEMQIFAGLVYYFVDIYQTLFDQPTLVKSGWFSTRVLLGF